MIKSAMCSLRIFLKVIIRPNINGVHPVYSVQLSRKPSGLTGVAKCSKYVKIFNHYKIIML